jgi:FKBP-type peptidyl-prolyl cis-trans isomerase FkpA
LYAASGYDSAPMAHSFRTFRLRAAGLIAGAVLAVLALGACGTVVPVSSSITPPPPDCSTPRPDSATDSFITTAVLQPGLEGLQYADISVGCGAAVSDTATVNVQFTVWLSTGKQIITTRGTNQPLNSLALSDPTTLAFWRLGIPGMKVGGTRRLVVPPALGFGASGNTSANVPANATLVVSVELVSLGTAAG